jgi:cell division septum initiation protein DivIVA
LLDRNEVERQHALQASEAADRAAAVVEGEVQSIMEHAEAGADEVRRNAERDAHHLREEAAATGSRVVERVEALAGALTEHAAQLRREVDGLHAPSGGQRET